MDRRRSDFRSESADHCFSPSSPWPWPSSPAGLGWRSTTLDQGRDLAAWLASPATDASREGPDIYAILLDGYPRADVLAHAFDIDNGPFVGALEERGFAVAGASHSDYIWTHTTVPSFCRWTTSSTSGARTGRGRPSGPATHDSLRDQPEPGLRSSRATTATRPSPSPPASSRSPRARPTSSSTAAT